MATKSRNAFIQAALMVAFLTADVVFSDDQAVIPADKSQLTSWFNSNVQPLASRKGTIDPALAAAENGATVVKVMQDGSGNFKTITAAINSIPRGNTKRVIVYIGGGNYNEKIKVDREKRFVTFYGAPGNMPNITYGGTALKYGTVDSATVIVESDYFVASNIIFSNTAPRPDGKMKDAQAVAFRISADKSSFYNCKFYGFQDTLLDDGDWHLYKDCLVQGTVDFIFGNGKALFLNTELRVLGDTGMTAIVAHGRDKQTDETAFSFVHCDITGTGNGTLLGRAWFSSSKVVFSYCNIGNVVNDTAWSNNNHPEYDSTLYFGEYQNKGPGAEWSGRPKFAKKLTAAEVKPFITLDFLQASKWLLPPPTGKV